MSTEQATATKTSIWSAARRNQGALPRRSKPVKPKPDRVLREAADALQQIVDQTDQGLLGTTDSDNSGR